MSPLPFLLFSLRNTVSSVLESLKSSSYCTSGCLWPNVPQQGHVQAAAGALQEGPQHLSARPVPGLRLRRHRTASGAQGEPPGLQFLPRAPCSGPGQHCQEPDLTASPLGYLWTFIRSPWAFCSFFFCFDPAFFQYPDKLVVLDVYIKQAYDRKTLHCTCAFVVGECKNALTGVNHFC